MMAYTLSTQDIQELMRQGHSEQEIREAMGELQMEEATGKSVPPPQLPHQLSAFQYNPSDNLVKWQLELNDILERAEHILKEDIVMMQNGETFWSPHPHPEKRIFNDYGVQEVLRVLSMYINRNTILSWYTPEEILDKVYDFGKEMNDLIFMKYEHFGLDDEHKRKNYPILIRQLIDIVHSAYNRARHGGERTSLREARSIQQQEQLIPRALNSQTGEIKKERGFLNPSRILKGKYI